MSGEDNDRRDVAQGHQARRELDLMDGAFARLKAGALEEIVQTSLDQVEKRERLYRVAHVSDQVRTMLLRLVDAGEMANARMALAEENLLRP